MNDKNVKKRTLFVVSTKEVSIHSGLHVEFYLKTEENCKIFMEALHNIEWVMEKKTIPFTSKVKSEVIKNPLELVSQYKRWADYFEMEHKYRKRIKE